MYEFKIYRHGMAYDVVIVNIRKEYSADIHFKLRIINCLKMVKLNKLKCLYPNFLKSVHLYRIVL